MNYFDRGLLETPQTHPLLGNYIFEELYKDVESQGFILRVDSTLTDVQLVISENLLSMVTAVNCYFIIGYKHPILKNQYVLLFEWDSIMDSIFLTLSDIDVEESYTVTKEEDPSDVF